MNPAPLSGLLVLELASVLAGPSVGMFFAELGARVIKIENLHAGGDVTRTWRLKSESVGSDRSAYFSAVNWGKESIALDLGNTAGQAVVHAMASQADIVLLSYKPGDAAKLNMDAPTLQALNPRLIYAALTAYGADDPRPGFDAIIQAEAGFTYMNGQTDGAPTKMPVALMDLLAAHQLKEACLLALFERSRTGKGAVISVSLLASALSSLANQATNYLMAGHIPQRIGSEHPNIVPYGTIFSTQDGKSIVLAIGSDTQFRQLCHVLELDNLADKAEFARNQARVSNREQLNTLLTEAIRLRARDPLLQALARAHVPAGAVHDMSEALAQAQAKPLKLDADGISALRGVAFEIEGYAKEPMNAPPHLNADGRALLREFCALDEAGIDDLIKKGVAGNG
jgi:crotonobetainyl-CoA:carnitine CoA-transferase CaiB-like acyl-CoA transferase